MISDFRFKATNFILRNRNHFVEIGEKLANLQSELYSLKF
jgi:hypothetical protein